MALSSERRLLDASLPEDPDSCAPWTTSPSVDAAAEAEPVQVGAGSLGCSVGVDGCSVGVVGCSVGVVGSCVGVVGALEVGLWVGVCVTVTVRIPLLPEFVDANTATGQFVVERDRYVDG